jgi:hypothetical protein
LEWRFVCFFVRGRVPCARCVGGWLWGRGFSGWFSYGNTRTNWLSCDGARAGVRGRLCSAGVAVCFVICFLLLQSGCCLRGATAGGRRTYSKRILVQYQLSQGDISCPKAISAIPKQYRLSQSNISFPKLISALPTAHRLSQGNISSRKSTPAFPRKHDLKPFHQRMNPRAESSRYQLS